MELGAYPSACDEFVITDAPGASAGLRQLCILKETEQCATTVLKPTEQFVLSVETLDEKKLAQQLLSPGGISESMWKMEQAKTRSSSFSWSCEGAECRWVGSAQCGTNGALRTLAFDQDGRTRNSEEFSVCDFVPELTTSKMTLPFSGEIVVSFCEDSETASSGQYTFNDQATVVSTLKKSELVIPYGPANEINQFKKLQIDMPTQLFQKWLNPDCELTVNDGVISAARAKSKSNDIRRNSKAFTVTAQNRSEKGWHPGQTCQGSVLATENVERYPNGRILCAEKCLEKSGCYGYAYTDVGAALLQTNATGPHNAQTTKDRLVTDQSMNVKEMSGTYYWTAAGAQWARTMMEERGAAFEEYLPSEGSEVTESQAKHLGFSVQMGLREKEISSHPSASENAETLASENAETDSDLALLERTDEVQKVGDVFESSLERKGPTRRRRRTRRRRSRRRRTRRRRTSECKLYQGGSSSSGSCTNWDYKSGMQSVTFSSNAQWRQEVASAPVLCGPGSVVQSVDLKATGWDVTCAAVGGLGACAEHWTPDIAIGNIQSMKELTRTAIVCPKSEYIGAFVFEFSDSGNWMRWTYACCKAGGVPTSVVMTNRVTDYALAQAQTTSLLLAEDDGLARDLQGKLKTMPQSLDIRYSLGEAGEDGCEEYLTEASCRSAASLAKTSYQSAGSFAEFPEGCFQKLNDNKFYFNNNVDGKGSTSAKPVCAAPLTKGIFHAVQIDEVGRYQYQLLGKNLMLKLKPTTGQWCIDSNCGGADSTGAVTPVGFTVGEFEIGEVSDFDGYFAGGGAFVDVKPLMKKPKLNIKMPELPKQPRVKKPKLAKYNFKQTQYAGYCKFDEMGKVGPDDDQQDLWGTVPYSEDAPKPYKMEFSGEQAGEGHPCHVAQENLKDMPYSTSDPAGKGIDQCNSREIERAWNMAQYEATHAEANVAANAVVNIASVLCSGIPNGNVMPLGLGISMKGEMCEDAIAAKAGAWQITENLVAETVNFGNEYVGYGDCDPLQTQFTRLFCDVYCVRDAVVRGDATVNSNLAMASKTIKKNMEMLAKWNVDTTRAQAKYYGNVHEVTAGFLSGLLKQVYDLIPEPESSLQVTAGVEQMLGEMNDFVQRASVNKRSQATAERALAEFVSKADVLSEPNASSAEAAVQQTIALHGILEAAGRHSSKDKTNAVVTQNVDRVMRATQMSIQTIGMYRKSSATAHQRVRSFSAERAASAHALVELDKIWWRLRGKLDSYMDHAEAHLKVFDSSLQLLQQYQQCSAKFSDLLPAYKDAMKAREADHNALRTTWTESSNLMGELAAVISDTEVFQTFVRNEGCNSTLAEQTVQQTQLAFGGMNTLQQRFNVGGLGKLNTATVDQAMQRIAQSLREAHAACPK